MAIYQYSSDQMSVAWQGLDFSEGLADGTSFGVARTAQRFAMTPGVSGRQTRVKNTDDSVTITLLVVPDSQLHSQLIAKANADDSNADVVGPMVVRNELTGATQTYSDCFIASPPDEPFENSSRNPVSWIFMASKVTTSGPGPDSTVGD